MGKGERGGGAFIFGRRFFIRAFGVKFRFVWFLAKVQFPLSSLRSAVPLKGAFLHLDRDNWHGIDSSASLVCAMHDLTTYPAASQPPFHTRKGGARYHAGD